MGNEALPKDGVAAEDGDGQVSRRVTGGEVGIFPDLTECPDDAVRRKIPVSAHLLKTKHIHPFFAHQAGYLFARIACDFFSKVVYVVRGYL